MDRILAHLLEGLEKGDFAIISIVLTVALIFNISNISRFLDERRKSRIDLIKDSLNNACVVGRTKDFMEQLLEQEYFKLATGITLEREVREALIKAHSETQGSLKFKHFKRAIPFITYNKRMLGINIDFLSIFGAIYSFVVGCMSVIFGFFLFILPAFNVPSLVQLLSIYGVSVFLILFGAVMLLQALPVLSAKFVKKALEEIHNKAI